MSSEAWKSPESISSPDAIAAGKSVMKFLRRNSTGSMSSLRASVSTARSIAYVASGRPAPRYASVGVVFVKTPTHSKSYASTS